MEILITKGTKVSDSAIIFHLEVNRTTEIKGTERRSVDEEGKKDLVVLKVAIKLKVTFKEANFIIFKKCEPFITVILIQ